MAFVQPTMGADMLSKFKGGILTAGIAVAAAAGSAPAQDFRNSPEFRLEMAYIQALTEARMTDYAALVTKDLEKKYPEAGTILKTLKLEQMLQLGKFDEAMAMIVRGFVEPIARELPMEYALELNRLIELQMEGAVG